MPSTQNLKPMFTQVTESYVQRGDEQIFLSKDEFSKVETDVNTLMKTQAFASFFSSLGKPMADIQIKVVGKCVYFSAGEKSVKLKTSEEVEKIKTKSKEEESLKTAFQSEAKQVEVTAGKIDAIAESVIKRHESESLTTTPGLNVTLDVKPPVLVPAAPLPLFIPPKPSPRASSRKLIVLKKRVKELETKAKPAINALKQKKPYGVKTTSDVDYKSTYFDNLSREEKVAVLQEVFTEAEQERIGQSEWQKVYTLSKDYAKYKGYDKKPLAIEKLIDDPALFKAEFRGKARAFQRIAEKKIYQRIDANYQTAQRAIREAHNLVLAEEARLKDESDLLDQASMARQDPSPIPASADKLGLFLSGRIPQTIPGLGALIRTIPNNGDPRIISLQSRGLDEIHYDDLIYLVRYELSHITQADGKIDRSQAILLKPENKILERLVPLSPDHEGVTGAMPLTKEAIDALANSKQALLNVQLGYALLLEYFGFEFNPENIDVAASQVVPLLDPTEVPHFALDDKEHSRIARLLLFPKEIERVTKGEYAAIPFFKIPAALYMTLAKLSHSNPQIAKEFAKTSALGTSTDPGSWRKILSF